MSSGNESIRKYAAISRSCASGFLILLCVSTYIILTSKYSVSCPTVSLPHRKYVTQNDTDASKLTDGYKVWRQTSTISGPTAKFPRKHTIKEDKRGIVCPVAAGGLGNQMFQFASEFGIAMLKNMSLVIDKNILVNRVFNLTVKTMNNNSFCDKLERKSEKRSGTYDSDLLNFNSSKNFRIGYYLQSWKYFYNFTTELKKQLVFRHHIQVSVSKTIKEILQKNNVKYRNNVTLVGVHIRRGDKLNVEDANLASPEYLRKSFSYFKRKYNNVVFIVASNDMTWTKANMPDKINVEYINGSPETDMATLASCDHVITTIGTFSWWCGWFVKGEVTYFKWPAKPGTAMSWRITYEDFFYPGWIGL